ncbi:MAG TPA: hypothetical protein VNO21_27520, partial [Polyangiaceae bacterium]|nr:hypothetical protein [Polyangiaceae bacterium]
MDDRTRAWLSKAPLLVATAGLAYWMIGGILTKLDHPGATLDDSFIHFQYARSLAEGHPLRFQADAPISTGATSWLWPFVLAPFYLLGFRDLAILWPAWILSFTALALLALEVHRLTRPLAGPAAALCAGAMVPAFGGLVWCASSGMEAVPFAWTIATTARLCAEWAEGQRTTRRFWALVLFSWMAVLFRPEGAVFTAAACVTLLAFPPASKGRVLSLATGLLPLAMPLLVASTLRLLSGSALTATAHVKLLVGNPYYTGAALREAVLANLKTLYVTLLNGQVWAGGILPANGGIFGILGLAAVVVLGVREKRPWRAMLVVMLALGIAIPCLYVSFLWNRLRYLWPFASGWLVGLGCLSRLAGDGLGRLRARWRIATPIVGGCFVGLFAAELVSTQADVVNSASGIDRQQVKLGRWAKDHLPENARIGLNDTGAIAYLSERRTFDVVGLTTPSEGRYWVAGPGSRFEHYERLAKTDRGRLPTHFIVYPEWMACDAVLGDTLTEAVVLDSTILGGTTMRAYRAEWSFAGSGELPWSAGTEPNDLLDTLDVADLESEAEHDYDLASTRDGQNLARFEAAPNGRPVADGGRAGRRVERFVMHLREGTASFV